MDIKINDDPGFETPGSDPMDQARHCFKKGRLEFMGGPIVYEQGQNYKGLMNNNRRRLSSPDLSTSDPIARELGVDVQEY